MAGVPSRASIVARKLPTTWFEGKNRHYYVFINQSLAALAKYEPSLTKAQLWHTQSGHDTFPAQTLPYKQLGA